RNAGSTVRAQLLRAGEDERASGCAVSAGSGMLTKCDLAIKNIMPESPRCRAAKLLEFMVQRKFLVNEPPGLKKPQRRAWTQIERVLNTRECFGKGIRLERPPVGVERNHRIRPAPSLEKRLK